MQRIALSQRIIPPVRPRASCWTKASCWTRGSTFWRGGDFFKQSSSVTGTLKHRCTANESPGRSPAPGPALILCNERAGSANGTGHSCDGEFAANFRGNGLHYADEEEAPQCPQRLPRLPLPI